MAAAAALDQAVPALASAPYQEPYPAAGRPLRNSDYIPDHIHDHSSPGRPSSHPTARSASPRWPPGRPVPDPRYYSQVAPAGPAPGPRLPPGALDYPARPVSALLPARAAYSPHPRSARSSPPASRRPSLLQYAHAQHYHPHPHPHSHSHSASRHASAEREWPTSTAPGPSPFDSAADKSASPVASWPPSPPSPPHHIEALGSMSSGHSTHSHHVVATYDPSGADDVPSATPTPRQTVKSLLHVGFLALPLSVAVAVWTLVIMLAAALLAPLRLCCRGPSWAARVAGLLLPALELLRGCVHARGRAQPPARGSASSRAPLTSEPKQQQPQEQPPAGPPTSTMITTLLGAPFVALPLALAAWVMAVTWGLGAIVSDERSGDDRDERGFAERVVSGWARWLDRGMGGWAGDSPYLARAGAARRPQQQQQPQMDDRGGSLFV